MKIKLGEIGQMVGLLVWNTYAEFRKINNRAQYKVKLEEIIRILQYPRYLFHINELFGERGASIIENILLHGQIEQKKCILDQLQFGFSYEKNALKYTNFRTSNFWTV